MKNQTHVSCSIRCPVADIAYMCNAGFISNNRGFNLGHQAIPLGADEGQGTHEAAVSDGGVGDMAVMASSGLLFDLRRPLGADQFWPNSEPCFLAQVPPFQLSGGGVFKPAGLSRIHVPTARQALVKVGLADSGQFSQAPTLGNGWECLHRDSDTSDSLTLLQANRYGVTPSNALEALLMETSGERRRRKLEGLCKERGIDVVAEAAGKSAAYLDQIIKRRLLPPKLDGSRSPRQLGDAVAQAIERALNLGVGWFDLDDKGAVSIGKLNQLQEMLLKAFAKFDTDEDRLEALSRMNALAERKRNGPPATSIGEALNALKPRRRRIPKSLVKPRVSKPLRKKPKEQP